MMLQFENGSTLFDVESVEFLPTKNGEQVRLIVKKDKFNLKALIEALRDGMDLVLTFHYDADSDGNPAFGVTIRNPEHINYIAYSTCYP